VKKSNRLNAALQAMQASQDQAAAGLLTDDVWHVLGLQDVSGGYQLGREAVLQLLNNGKNPGQDALDRQTIANLFLAVLTAQQRLETKVDAILSALAADGFHALERKPRGCEATSTEGARQASASGSA